MKIINVDIDDRIILKNIEDTDTGTVKSINSDLKLPYGNYQSILLNYNFINPIPNNNLNLFTNFKIDNRKQIDVEITSVEVNGTTYTYASYIPAEVFEKQCRVLMGVYGFSLDDEENLKIRLSLIPIMTLIITGSYEPEKNENITPGPTIFENYFNKIKSIESQLENSKNDYDTFVSLYNSKPYYFNNISSLKNANLKIGDMAITLGYYQSDDRGGGEYSIRLKNDEDIEDNGSIHFLQNGNVAELVFKDNSVNVKQFGAKGDGIADDSNAFTNAINSNAYNIMLFDETYYLSEEITIKSNKFLVGNGTKIIAPSLNAINSDVSENSIFRVILGPVAKFAGIEFICENNQVPGIYKTAGEETIYKLSNKYSVLGIQSTLIIDNCKFTDIYGVSNVHGDIDITNCTGTGVGMFAYINEGVLRSSNNVIDMAASDLYYHVYYINKNGNLYSYNNKFNTDILYDIYHLHTSDSNPFATVYNDVISGKYLSIGQITDGTARFFNCWFSDDYDSESAGNRNLTLYNITNSSVVFKNCIINRYLNYLANNMTADIYFQNTTLVNKNSFANWLGKKAIYRNCNFSTPGTFSAADDTSTYYGCQISCNALVTTGSASPTSKYYNNTISSYDSSSDYAIGVTNGQSLKFINNVFENFVTIKTTGTNVNEVYYINNILI